MSAVGLLLLDKPEGPTSHDVVAAVRRATGTRRVGHTGTLDPFASGLLIVCLGWATRLAEYLSALPKVYRGAIRFGVRTATDDGTGVVVSESDGWRELSVEQVERALASLLGEIEQRPPSYSAKQSAGRRAYELARRGESPELAPVRVTVRRLSLREFDPPLASFEIECSSGTYVRAVARDVGEALGVGAHLATLRRTRIGSFGVEQALAFERELAGEALLARLLDVEAAVAHLRQIEIDGEEAHALRAGRPLAREAADAPEPAAALRAGELVAIVEARGGRLWPRKVFPPASGAGAALR